MTNGNESNQSENLNSMAGPLRHTTPATESEHVEQKHSGRGTSTFANSNTQKQTYVKYKNIISFTSAPDETSSIVSGSVTESTLL